MRQLVLIDIAQIQNYIIPPGRLRLRFVRGASLLLQGVADGWRKLVQNEERNVLVSSGGNFCAVLPDEAAAEAFQTSARQSLLEATGGVVVVNCAAVNFQENDKFAVVYKALLNKVALEKYRGKTAQFSEGGSFWAQCDICGGTPASALVGEPKLIVCGACNEKLEANNGDVKNANRPEDFAEIGAASKPQNYLAFVHIDFDQMGRFFEKASEQGQDWFRELSDHFNRSVVAGLQRAKDDKKTEILLQGGDDIALVMPVERWTDFLKDFASEFKRVYESSAIQNKPALPTFSAGVVIAHTHFPIGEFLRISKILEGSAKTLQDENSVDFEIIAGAFSGDPIAFRDNAGKAEKGGHYRSSKPYTLSKLQDLLEIKETLSDFPANKIKQLHRLAWGSPAQASLDYLYLLSRLDPENRVRLERAVGSSLFQPPENCRVVTKAADVAEIWSLK